MGEIPWVLHNNEIVISTGLLIKASLYFWAPPNFVHLTFVVPPLSNFPSALLPMVPHFFLFDNNFFLLEPYFPPPNPKMNFLYT